MEEKTYTLNIRQTGTWHYEIPIPEIDVMKTAPTLESALTITLHDIATHFMSRSLILVFAEQPDDKNTQGVGQPDRLCTHREDQAAFERAQQGIAPHVRRREHHLVFALSHPLTRVQTTWLNTHMGKLFHTYYIKDELEVVRDTFLEEARGLRKATTYE